MLSNCGTGFQQLSAFMISGLNHMALVFGIHINTIDLEVDEMAVVEKRLEFSS